MANLGARAALAGADEQCAEAELDTSVLRLYSDMLDPVSQPQLPPDSSESRHRSLLDMGLRTASSDQAPLLHREVAYFKAGHPQQEESPIELRTPGFVGLFGRHGEC